MAATAERTTIATTGLTKRYDDVVALDEVSVELVDDAIGLLGANGAGKSTLMRALLGLVAPDAGTATLLGIDAAARGLELRAAHRLHARARVPAQLDDGTRPGRAPRRVARTAAPHRGAARERGALPGRTGGGARSA